MENIEISTREMNTGGEPLRIVQSGYPDLQGKTILEKINYVIEKLDHLRKYEHGDSCYLVMMFIMFEPRGHSGMFGAMQVDADLPDADAAFLFMHQESYPTMCGHAVICLGRYCIDNKIAKYNEPEAEVKIQCPCGLVSAYVECADGKTGAVRFNSVPAFASHLDHTVSTPSYGNLKVDIGFGGGFFGFLPLADVGLTPESSLLEIKKAGTEVKNAVKEQVKLTHPIHQELTFFSGLIFTDDNTLINNKGYNLIIFGKAAFDRSPCGSGTTARMAILHAKKMVTVNQIMEIENPKTKSVFRTQVVETTKLGEHEAVVVEIKGNGYYTGSATFTAEKEDPLREGFLLL